MATKQLFVRHLFDGGYATDFGPAVDIAPDKAGFVRLPFLLDADNCIFEFDGGPHKAPGTSRLNATVLESGAVIKGLFDAWFTGTGGSSAQHRVAHVGTKIVEDDADGVFADLFTGLESDKVPSYAMLEDILVMASDSNTDVPKSWDGTTAQNLAGSPPNFAFMETHKNKMWAAGDASNPSRLYYSVSFNAADWIGGGSGTIDIDPDDGDSITGIISHKDELWVFKGPYKGSIHRITGSAPTGGDPFARKLFIKGLGAVGHNTLFRFGDDIGFMWSDGTIHSLAATDAFGDFNEAALSRPINIYLRQHLNFNRLKHAYAVNWSDFGFVLFSVPIDSSQQNNQILMMDYRFDNGVRWAPWPSFSVVGGALASVVDSGSSNRRIVMGGGTDGWVRKLGQPGRSIDNLTAISYKVATPHLTYGQAIQLKMISGGSIGLQPKNAGNLTLGWTRDGNAQQTQIVTQGGGVLLDTFLLDTDILGGGRFVDRFFELEEGGEFRSISLEVTNNALGEDVEIHSISAVLDPGTWSWENT